MSKGYIGCGALKRNKNIERTKKYAGDQNVELWGIFFSHQRTVLDNYITRYWPLHNPFTCNISVSLMVSTTYHQSLDNIELNNLLCPRQRDITLDQEIHVMQRQDGKEICMSYKLECWLQH